MRSLSKTAIAIAAIAGLSRSAGSQTEASFTEIARVLRSPRCMNCHPAGDAPLQTDESRPHKQNIKRIFSSLGGSCTSCHQEIAIPGDNIPPGAPHWSMPPAETPMIFEGKTEAELCADLQDPEMNGHRTLEDLVHHVDHDPLVLWAFDPGGDRTPPPMTHAEFVALMSEWVAQGAPCPE
jgi:hypothetical protein